MKSIYFLAAAALLSGGKALADDATCLARIMNAESRGENFEGIVSIGQAAITRADDTDSNLCDVPGVHRKRPSKSMAAYYLSVARELLTHPSTSVSQGATHWNTGSKPAHPGTVTRKIDNHVFYTIKPKGEK